MMKFTNEIHFDYKKLLFATFTASLLILTACTPLKNKYSGPSTTDNRPEINAKIRRTSSVTLIRSDYKPGEIAQLCKSSIEKVAQELNFIASIPESNRNIDNTLFALEKTLADFSDNTLPLTFMGYVSTDTAISEEGASCEADVAKFSVEIFSRRDLYQAFVKVTARNSDEIRLLQKTREAFEQNGLKLPDDVLVQVRDLKGKLSGLETQFSTNLNKDNTTVLLTQSEIEGLPTDYVAELKKDSNGNFILNTKESDYALVMKNAVQSEVRKKMMLGYLNRAGVENTQLLAQAVGFRSQIAKLMGYKTWSDYRTDGRMAQNSANVINFLNGLKTKLAERNRNDMNRILKFVQESNPSATHLNQWDIAYYSNQLQKRDYSLDDEKIREYFPADLVISGMFQIYSKMLGVRFEEIKDAKVWATGVQLFAIHNSDDDSFVGYFYTDFYPRAGKYGHAAAFPLISARTLPDGSYSRPVASIVANLSPPMNGKPSLLSHDNVETIFHEFGHIMHQTLTLAPYASLSGSAVAQDFVEAPSQMLENWVWDARVLNIISGHYLDHSQKLPDELIQKMLAAKDFNQGYSYTKQLLYASFDMTIHSQAEGGVDVNQTYLDLYKQIMGQEPLAGQKFPASFGHMMGGYDAGYYGYLWSEVYAQDMFSKFPPENIVDAEVGIRYKRAVLERGNMKDPIELLREFLGREPSPEAFFRKLKI